MWSEKISLYVVLIVVAAVVSCVTDAGIAVETELVTVVSVSDFEVTSGVELEGTAGVLIDVFEEGYQKLHIYF